MRLSNFPLLSTATAFGAQSELITDTMMTSTQDPIIETSIKGLIAILSAFITNWLLLKLNKNKTK